VIATVTSDTMGCVSSRSKKSSDRPPLFSEYETPTPFYASCRPTYVEPIRIHKLGVGEFAVLINGTVVMYDASGFFVVNQSKELGTRGHC
jgi:hypothetical protein